MLTQFRIRYPKGSLTSELLAIEQGKYIVKVLVQVEGITLATGLAASFSLEEAEDNARIRALTTLNLDATSIPLSLANSSLDSPQKGHKQAPNLYSEEQPKVGLSNLVESIQEPEFPKEVEQLPTPNSTRSSFNGAKKAEIDRVAIGDHGSNHSDALNLSPPAPEEPLISSSVSESLEPEPVAAAPAKIPAASKSAKTTKRQAPEPEPVVEETPPEPEVLPLVESTPEVILPESLEPLEETPAIEAQLKTEEIEALTPPIQPTYPPIEPLDFSDIMARSNAQLKRLGWTTEKGRDYLLKTYGKKSRHLLNDEELLQFLNYLESLPSSVMEGE